jgi:tetratricopeptide (TPR) repeat protein
MFMRAAEAAPENARYRANMATALGLLGRYEEALALFEQVVPPADAHRNLAVLCEARNDMSRAAEARRRADGLSLRGDPQ